MQGNAHNEQQDLLNEERRPAGTGSRRGFPGIGNHAKPAMHLAGNLFERNGGLPRGPSDARHGAPKRSYRRDVFGHVASRRRAGEYIESPIQHIGDVDRLIWSDGHEVSPRHLARLMARLTEGADDLAVLIQLDNTVISACLLYTSRCV